MAEIKRIPLQSVDSGTQSSKKEKEKQVVPSIRFELNLSESNDKKYSEFNYAQLLKVEQKKIKKDKKKDENIVSNGLSALDEDDEDDRALDVARYYESKYGNRKGNDYVDLGAGYDESDSFIDNTDAYDELVPQEVTTWHGGFYVNSGPLEFKNSENARDLLRNNINNDNENGNDDESESSEEDSDEQEDSVSTKAKVKRLHSSSENEEVEEMPHPPKSKPRLDETEYSTAE